MRKVRTFVLASSEKVIVYVPWFAMSVDSTLDLSGKCNFDFQSFARSAQRHHEISGKCHFDCQRFARFEQMSFGSSGTCNLDFQSFARSAMERDTYVRWTINSRDALHSRCFHEM